MKKFILFFILFFIWVTGSGFNIINRLEMPTNKIYYENLPFKLTNIVPKHETKAPEVEKENVETVLKEQFKLTGIIKINNTFFAILNGNSYSTGDTINGFEIKSIDIGKVLLVNKLKKERLILKIEN